MKRIILLMAAGVAAAGVSGTASAHVDVGLFLGVPAPVYMAPPVVYEEAPPPVVYQAPPVIYGPAPIIYGDRDEYWKRGRWHDNGRHRGWERRHDREDDDD